MTLTITNLTVPSVVGPGYVISLSTTLAGPTLLDDVYSVEITDPALGNFFCGGFSFARGFTFANVVLGISYAPSVVPQIDANGVLDRYIAPGATVTLELQLAHANFTVVDTGTSTGWTWDPTGGLYRLMAGAGSSGSVDDVLAAVRRTFP